MIQKYIVGAGEKKKKILKKQTNIRSKYYNLDNIKFKFEH